MIAAYTVANKRNQSVFPEDLKHNKKRKKHHLVNLAE